ncbi:MAG TPA: hypothetical protein VEW48_21180 [Thermoanaerobaculia bacterium]|nr:hypothetical protein [Thermoanaerobaculia bacterium]
MPNSQADVIRDWEGLIDAVLRSPEVLPSVEPERQVLADILDDVQDLKARQEELNALRQEVTQKLLDTIARGKEVAIQIRSVLRGKVGAYNERLVHYNIAPIRRRPRKPPVVKPPVVETPEAGPAAADSPPVHPDV